LKEEIIKWNGSDFGRIFWNILKIQNLSEMFMKNIIGFVPSFRK